MNRKVVVSLLAVLLMPGASVFAQFKTEAQATKNLANLDRVIARATKGVVIGRPVVTDLPQGLVRGNAVGLLRVKAPKVITPVTKSYATFLNNSVAGEGIFANYPIVRDFSEPAANEWAANPKRVFYEDQTELARDLNAWYQGQANVFIGPDGREVKLYALPVDGILYKPVGYRVPVMLNSSDYFVIYDVAAQTGKIAENTPEVYNLFKPRLEDAIWSAMGTDKVFDDLNNLCDAVLLAHLHKARLAKLQAAGNTQEVSALVKEGKGEVYKQLNTREELLGYLKQLPKVRQVINGNPAYLVYLVELPVEGLTWVDREGTKHVYHSKDHVMVFFEMGSVGVFPRADVENPVYFTPVKSTQPAINAAQAAVTAKENQRSKNVFWKFYEYEKQSWHKDRQSNMFETLWGNVYTKDFNSQAELGKALHSFHHGIRIQVASTPDYEISEVYEIPVKHLNCVVDGKTIAIDPDEYVFLYNAHTGGKLVKRAEVEDVNLYEFVNK